jgi:hypothetical protein
MNKLSTQIELDQQADNFSIKSFRQRLTINLNKEELKLIRKWINNILKEPTNEIPSLHS